MNYEEIKILKHSQKSVIYLVRDKDSGQTYIKKVLHGNHPIYSTLQSCAPPFIPRLYEVILEEASTTILEEYIESSLSDSEKITERQAVRMTRELCTALEFLHGKGIIHRDIKPSNIILAKDGHIRLIDFDAARTLKDMQEQDTRLLGTRGYAPPEQYGFSQTDERSDIYALGVTLKQLLGKHAQKPRYQKIIRKCTELDPNKRYQSVRQVKSALTGQKHLLGMLAAAVLLTITAGIAIQTVPASDIPSQSTELTVLPAPADPHWDGETGIATWGNVHESGIGNEVRYSWRLYKCDTPTPPDLVNDEWEKGDYARGNVREEEVWFPLPLADELEGNGYYYFAVCASGDGVQYADSPYVLSEAFHFTGEDAPPLPIPEKLAWRIIEGDESREYFATWDLEPYADTDMFYVYVYDENGNNVMATYKRKSDLIERQLAGKIPGAYVNAEFMSSDESFRFAVQALTSRPNEYSSSPAVYPCPTSEEFFSPWYSNSLD